jgi:hypothetical protein
VTNLLLASAVGNSTYTSPFEYPRYKRPMCLTMTRIAMFYLPQFLLASRCSALCQRTLAVAFPQANKHRRHPVFQPTPVFTTVSQRVHSPSALPSIPCVLLLDSVDFRALQRVDGLAESPTNNEYQPRRRGLGIAIEVPERGERHKNVGNGVSGK